VKVSLVTTERNEVESIAEFIESALSQSLKPDEIIIADGGSTDGTQKIIQDYIAKGAPIKLLDAPGNRSIGRNAATAAAKNEIIAVTDVGCRLDKDWLKNISAPFKDSKVMTVAGFYIPEPQTYFEEVSATLMYYPNDHIDIKTWLPSSRSVAYKKEAWKKVGGYPEHTNFNEDTPFDLRLKEAGYQFADGLKAVVYWRPRPDLKQFYQQFYWYAVGDGLDNIMINSIILLSAKYTVMVFGTVALAILMPLALIPWLALIIAMYIRKIWGPWKKVGGFKTALMMMGLLIVFHYSQIRGFWHGYTHKAKLRGGKTLVR
jgi:glycosyltransferase involved in cell wall biosynthesis